MSVFLAVDLDDVVRAKVVALIEQQRQALDAKWLRADKLHLTLVFLGNATTEHVGQFKPVIDALARRHRPFELSLAGAGTFGTARAPSVSWLGVQGAVAELAALQADAAAVLLTQPLPGLKPEAPERRFTPHVTLARSKREAAFVELTKLLAGFSTPS
ncbi:MAG: RNA 2',3'-cyclic phosphodiesterase, partial [Archangium sp.]|nr:RNA 2',3'-cyclic phosphodiesterase [Archangium sp.]